MKAHLIALSLIVSSSALASPFAPILPEQVPAGDDYGVVQPPVESAKLFAGKTVAILASHGVESGEIEFPYEYLTARGARVEILTPSWTGGGIVVSRFLRPSEWATADGSFADGRKRAYDLVVLTGGAWNSQVVRTDEDALALMRAQYSAGKPLAAICSGTLNLINAGIARGTRLTGSPPVSIDLINAGAEYVDEAAVITGNLLTSRTPGDLPAFVEGLKTLLQLNK